ncbi:MAG: 6-phosphogluconolactonase [Chlamydiota bacterium]
MRKLVVPGDSQKTLQYCVEHFVRIAQESIQDHGAFYVALSGGSTPKAIFQHLCGPPYLEQIDWSKVHLFWSDERAVAPTDPDSNFHMAMEAGLKNMPIPQEHIHRMVAESHIEENALAYENTILKNRPFDLVMLGMGDDGHTASLFPHTEGLKVKDRLVIANYIPEKNTWRMTFTFPCINNASHIAVYILGAGKKQILKQVLAAADDPSSYPVLQVGTPDRPSLWIADQAASPT